jgi:hypothetical protein
MIKNFFSKLLGLLIKEKNVNLIVRTRKLFENRGSYDGDVEI